MDPILKKAAEFADGMLDLISWVGNRVESKKRLATAEDVIGQNAEITIPIKKGQTGEVIVVFENTRLTYGARGADTEAEFHKGEIALVQRVAGSLVYVEKRIDANEKSALSKPEEKTGESLKNSSTTNSGSNTNSSSAASGTSGGSKKKSKKENTELLDDKHTEGHS